MLANLDISIFLAPEYAEALREKARLEGRSVDDVVNEMLIRACDENMAKLGLQSEWQERRLRLARGH